MTIDYDSAPLDDVQIGSVGRQMQTMDQGRGSTPANMNGMAAGNYPMYSDVSPMNGNGPNISRYGEDLEK